ncbi:hypothetical protein E0H73_39925 [Kribbella pittospori]|uniref:Uncharacterized protein n=1 Tax=Kribbella pittospori TaxID=722689 RepID=A0A4R0JX66_9ACTN|nr:hypothetical protein [Kribbella pittospori]TCC52111.1 hypothetical protein E0H73_39925 [Kribbella pittospori]
MPEIGSRALPTILSFHSLGELGGRLTPLSHIITTGLIPDPSSSKATRVCWAMAGALLLLCFAFPMDGQGGDEIISGDSAGDFQPALTAFWTAVTVLAAGLLIAGAAGWHGGRMTTTLGIVASVLAAIAGPSRSRRRWRTSWPSVPSSPWPASLWRSLAPYAPGGRAAPTDAAVARVGVCSARDAAAARGCVA